MLLSLAAETYVSDRKLARTPVYSAVRFASVIGDLPIEQVSQAHIEKFKCAAAENGWSAHTIKGTVKDLRTLTRHYCNFSPTVRVAVPHPKPKPTAIADLDKLWPHLQGWSRQWLAVSYWCCLRLDDSLRLMLTLKSSKWTAAEISWTARKTGREHAVPVPEWMSPWLAKQKLPFTRVTDWAQEIVRNELSRASADAGVPQVYPRNVRQRGLTEWKRASPDAGSLIHGSGLGVLDYYVSAVEILQSAMCRVRVPVCFGAKSAPEDELLNSFRMLDPQARELVVMTAKRMGRT